MDRRLRLKLPKLVLKVIEGAAVEDSEEAVEVALGEAVEEVFEEGEDVVIVKVDLEVDVVRVDTEVDVAKMASEVVAEMVTIAKRTMVETVAIRADVTN